MMADGFDVLQATLVWNWLVVPGLGIQHSRQIGPSASACFTGPNRGPKGFPYGFWPLPLRHLRLERGGL